MSLSDISGCIAIFLLLITFMIGLYENMYVYRYVVIYSVLSDE